MAKLIDTASRRGVQSLYGNILATNRPMIDLVRSLGFQLERSDDPTLTRARLSL